MAGAWILPWRKENTTKDVIESIDHSELGWQIREQVYKLSSALCVWKRISLLLTSNKLKYLGIKNYGVSNLP